MLGQTVRLLDCRSQRRYRRKRAQTLPWKTVKDAIGAALQARFVELEEGSNRLMLKISQGGGGWKFSCRINLLDGEPIEGVRFSAE